MNGSQRARLMLFAGVLTAAAALPGCERHEVTGIRAAEEEAVAGPRPIIGAPGPMLVGDEARREASSVLLADRSEMIRRLRLDTGDPAVSQRRVSRIDGALADLAARARRASTAADAPAGEAALSSEGEAPRIIDARTFATITDAGATSYGRVYAFTELNTDAMITHTVVVAITVDGASRQKQTITQSTFWPNNVFGTSIPVNGIDCTRSIKLAGDTKHEAKALFFAANPSVSYDDAGCGPPCPVNNPRQIQQPASVSYDPYATSTSDCGGTGGDGGSGSGSSCRQEYVRVDVSHDGGDTWTTYWDGTATVCD